MIEGDPNWETWACVDGDWRGRPSRWLKGVNRSGRDLEWVNVSGGDEARSNVGGWKMVKDVCRRWWLMTGFIMDTMAEVSTIPAGLVLVFSHVNRGGKINGR